MLLIAATGTLGGPAKRNAAAVPAVDRAAHSPRLRGNIEPTAA